MGWAEWIGVAQMLAYVAGFLLWVGFIGLCSAEHRRRCRAREMALSERVVEAAAAEGLAKIERGRLEAARAEWRAEGDASMGELVGPWSRN